MSTNIENMIRLFDRLRDMGFTLEEAQALRRIEMTLHRWAELECGDGNDHGSWCIVRGNKSPRLWDEQAQVWIGGFAHADDGKPFMEHHHYLHGNGKDYVTHTPIADKEAGALKRLGKIIEARNARNADAVVPYHQGDPRGCALYIVRASDVPAGQSVDCFYTRGVAVAA